MSTPPQPPVAPGPAEPFTLSSLMPAPTARVSPPPGYPPARQSWQLPPPRRVPSQPTRGPQWWRRSDRATRIVLIVAAILAPILVGGAIFISLTSRGGAPDTIRFDLVSCEYSGDVLPAVTAEFSATNTSGRDYRLTIKWLFRDRDGARLDTDTTRVLVPAGETVRGSETTLLPVAVHGAGATCGYALS